MLFSTTNELLLVQIWTPGWAPGPVWTQKKLFSSRNDLFLVQTWTLAGLLALCGPKRGCSQAEMSCFFSTDLNPGWAPGPVWTQKKLFSSRNELFLVQTWKLFSSRNELILIQTWTLAVLLALCGPKRGSSQAEMSCFRYRPGPWLGSWPCVDPKEAALKDPKEAARKQR